MTDTSQNDQSRDTDQNDDSRQRGRTGPLTPDVYATVVKRFYESTAVGHEFAHLSRFLNDADGAHPHSASNVPFLTAYEFYWNTEKEVAPDWDLEAVDYADPEKYSRDQAEKKKESPGTPGRLLFLRGSPSPQWLNVLGAAHGIDPEMPRRWMDTHTYDDHNPSNFFYPPLPTYAWNLLELPVVTICKRDATWRHQTQQGLDQDRKASAAAVRDYLTHSGRAIAPWELGQSVIRDVCLLDQYYLAIEQRITVCMVPAMADGTQAWTVLVWSDAGDNANMCANLIRGPWNTLPVHLRPYTCDALPTTGVYRPNMALAAYRMSKKRADVKLPTTAQLHIDYGSYLHTDVMARDPFYALRETLDVAAASERHFLNLIEDVLGRYIANLNGDGGDGGDGGSSSPFQSLSSFLYLQQVLLHHTQLIQRARESICIIAHHARWQPAARAAAAAASGTVDGGGGGGGGHGSDRSQSARTAASENYRHLYEHAQALTVRCQGSIQNLQNAMSIAESKKALEQAGRVAKLTYLASFFVPLGFTTSFFGMNLKILDKVPTRKFVAATVPIVVITVIIMFVDLDKLWRRTRRVMRCIWHKCRDRLTY